MNLLPLGCAECGWADDMKDGDVPLLCPRCGSPGVSLDVDLIDLTEELRRRFLKAQKDALSRWHAIYSDIK
jgi:hypothetical protein